MIYNNCMTKINLGNLPFKLLKDIYISILRRLGINLDHGHTWERLAPQYRNNEITNLLYGFVANLLPIYLSTKSDLLLKRARTEDQIKSASFALGDHYKLLKSLALSINAKNVIDIGTYTGMSAISFLDANCKVKSFDIVNSLNLPDNIITEDDISEEKISLICGDLFDDDFFAANINNFIDADIIFFDGPKFGGFEQKILPKILALNYYKNTIVVMDDIHMKKMKILWYELNYPRLDLSLLGHISGTGIIFPKFGKVNVSTNNY